MAIGHACTDLFNDTASKWKGPKVSVATAPAHRQDASHETVTGKPARPGGP